MRQTSADTPAIVFAKAPRPGSVKTRLIPHLGAEAAAALHARLVKHTLATMRRTGFRYLQLHGAPADDPFLRYCSRRYGAALVEQCAGDLGTRMHHAFQHALGDQGALLVGSDCPALTTRHLKQAAGALAEGADAVLVPVEDGGYALVGLAKADPRVFEGVDWGTDCVLEQTRERLRELGWRWCELDTLWDVDSAGDYERLIASRLLDPAPALKEPPPPPASGIPDSF